jgi:hypothetical protein
MVREENALLMGKHVLPDMLKNPKKEKQQSMIYLMLKATLTELSLF